MLSSSGYNGAIALLRSGIKTNLCFLRYAIDSTGSQDLHLFTFMKQT